MIGDKNSFELTELSGNIGEAGPAEVVSLIEGAVSRECVELSLANDVFGPGDTGLTVVSEDRFCASESDF
jgi:hypothetical protein